MELDGRQISRALIAGSSGGIGGALVAALRARGVAVVGLSRAEGFDITDEASIAAALAPLRALGGFDLVMVASGVLSVLGDGPEKRLRDLDMAHLAAGFAVNAAGPAVFLKHALALLPRDRACVFAALSARVGSISDNRLGGWYTYRAAKAALNQLLRTAAIEVARTHTQARVVALHPGTVRTRLSASFTSGDQGFSPEESAARMLAALAAAAPGFAYIDYDGRAIPP